MSKEQHQFQAETQKLLDLMIHSIYTNKEIFLRELISNASDAIDKLHFLSLTNPELVADNHEFEIFLVPDAESKTLTISDNGVGMDKEDMINNLGTIAQSGTKAFLEQLQAQQDGGNSKDLIGQFGVGFYSAFMVADKITVLSRKAGQEQAYQWESVADGSYTIEEASKDSVGTTITLHLLPEFSGENSQEDFTQNYKLMELVKKYSDYVRYPIKMKFTVDKPVLDDEGKPVEGAEPTKVDEIRTLNSMKPLWTKAKAEITTEEYTDFYQNLFHDWQAPLEVLHNKVEGTLEYTSLLYIPAQAPFNLYHGDYKAGLQLYSRHVFIMDNCQDLLPPYLGFVKGLVDSPDFSLNISRELLQQSRELKTIGKKLEKTILKNLGNMLKNDRTKYLKFWEQYGKSIKLGIYASAYTGTDTADKLKDLLLFPVSDKPELVTLQEYVDSCPEAQKVIYYATGKDAASIEQMPQMELLRDKGIKVLYFLDNVDEFAIEILREFAGKKFQSISRGDLDLDDVESQETKKETDTLAKDNEALIKDIQEVLVDNISEAKLTNRLKSAAVCLVSDAQGPSFAMEQAFAEMNNPMFKAKRILEINPKHPLFAKLQSKHDLGKDNPEFVEYCNLLYAQALLSEGIMPENPGKLAETIANLMSK